jgi:hypothetical protein
MKNMKVNGKDDIPYMKWKMKNVPNHQPDGNSHRECVPMKNSCWTVDSPWRLVRNSAGASFNP